MIHFRKLALVLILGFLPTQVQAEELSTERIIELLRPPANARSLTKTRGIAVDPGDVSDTSSPTVNLYINFEYNSSQLGQDAKITLDRLAAALKDDRLSDWDFLIGGHTDSVGSDLFNLALSEQRALSVKRYLVRKRGVSSGRLIEKGFGEGRLLNPKEPDSGVNRRVQITTLALPSQ